MEAVICLPVLLLFSLGVAQFAHLWYCRTIVHYAAYCAARAAVTAPAGGAYAQARAAAETVCAPIVFSNPLGGADIALPGLGTVRASGSIAGGNTTILRVNVADARANHYVSAQVDFGAALIFPLAGPVIGRTMALFAGGQYQPGAGSGPGGIYQNVGGDISPRIILTEKVYMPKPFTSSWGTP